MKVIKKNKYTIILLILFMIFMLFAYELKNIMMPDDNNSSYGNRLDNKENYPIDNSIYDKIDEKYKSNANVKNITNRLQGKIINIYITFDDKATVKDAKTIGEDIITFFNEDVLSFYSVQIFLIKDNKELNNFPIIGMKDPLSKTVSWTMDREITKGDDK